VRQVYAALSWCSGHSPSTRHCPATLGAPQPTAAHRASAKAVGQARLIVPTIVGFFTGINGIEKAWGAFQTANGQTLQSRFDARWNAS
jgi:hypothetical protein